MDTQLEKKWLKTANKQGGKNKELWTELDLLNNEFQIGWNWVKAHSTDKLNNEVDLLARDVANLQFGASSKRTALL